jgi:hypothetical protein
MLNTNRDKSHRWRRIAEVALQLSLCLAGPSCDKAKRPGGISPGGEVPAAANIPATSRTMVYTPIPKLGVQIKVPAESAIRDVADGIAVWPPLPHFCVVSLLPVHADSNRYEDWMTIIHKEHSKIAVNVRNENDWKIVYSTLDPATKQERTNVNMRVTVGQKQYDCGQVGETADSAACVVETCASIKAL